MEYRLKPRRAVPFILPLAPMDLGGRSGDVEGAWVLEGEPGEQGRRRAQRRKTVPAPLGWDALSAGASYAPAAV